MSTKDTSSPVIRRLPALPLRDMVVLPGGSASLFVGRPGSLRALELAANSGKELLLVAQKDSGSNDLSADTLYSIGVIAQVGESIRTPDNTVKAMVKAGERVRILSLEESDGALHAIVEIIPSVDLSPTQEKQYIAALKSQFEEYTQKGDRKAAAESAILAVKQISLGQLVDHLAPYCNLELVELQQILECHEMDKRAELLMKVLEERIDLNKIERRLRSRIKQQIDRNQREYYLTEQIKAAQNELGGDEEEDEFIQFKNKITKARMPAQAKNKAEAEIKKLRMMSPMSAEATVIRNYLGWLLDLPWSKQTRTKPSLSEAFEILEKQHHGLEEVKERVLEYLAVQSRVKTMQSTILCFVGPPGVGKTSLGEAIADATGRKFVRMALGGMRDEAEIRGHRRTYIGSMPGRIIQKMTQAGVNNPLFLLDEIDKLGMDYRGDPAAALLEVLDPEQNQHFSDHFLETEFDLSKVMFICTANTMNLPPALLDRLEVVHLSGYTEDEKMDIAQQHLLPKQHRLTGLSEKELRIAPEALTEIIGGYTQEAGVRQLERCLAQIARKTVLIAARAKDEAKAAKSVKAAKSSAKGAKRKKSGTSELQIQQLEDYLGVKRYFLDEASKKDRVGQITGLAWTQAGGDVLTIEAACISGGNDKLIKTGSLGEVMQESVQAALTVARNCTLSMNVVEGYPAKCDMHMHIPAGSTPKDGPSAGLAMTLAAISAVTHIPIKGSIAVTGEITLRGEVLRIGGLKEKLLAARRSGIQKVLIPADNEAELSKIPENITGVLEIVGVRWVHEVWEHAFEASALNAQIDALRNPAPPPVQSGHYSPPPTLSH